MKARGWVNLARGALFTVFAAGVIFGAVVSWHETLSLLPALIFASVGFVVTGRKPENAIGWLFLGVGAGFGLTAASNSATVLAAQAGHPTAWYAVTSGIAYNFLWLILLTLGIILPLQLFPDGVLSARWRPLLWISVGASAIGVLVAALATTITVGGVNYPNPIHPARWASVGNGVWVAALATLSVCGVLALVSTILRFRRSTGVERVQMRWFAFAGAVLVVTMSIPGLNSSDLAFGITFSLVPLSCGVAILRYHLYDIDQIISRTTSYAIVTGLLLATYAAIVATANQFLHTDSALVVAGATLAAAALARPVLRRVQDIVDRRFNRSRYDTVHTVDEFGSRLRNQVDPDQVSAELVSTVDATFEPRLVGVWIRQPI